MKWIWWELLKIQSGHDSVHRRTDGQTDKVIPVYPPFNFVEAAGITMFRHHPWPFTWSQIRIWTHLKLDESMARWHLKSPQSLSGRFLHLTLVTKWSRSWSWMPYSHPLCSMSIGPPIMRYSYFKIWQSKSLVKAMRVVKGQGHIWPWKFKGKGCGQGQTHWSHLRPGVQSIC